MARRSWSFERIGWPAAWLLLLALTAVLRLQGLGQLLPYLPEPDCCVPVQVELIEARAEQPRRVFGWESYPHLLARATVLATDPLPRPALEAPLEEHLAAAGDSIRRVRVVGTWISLAMVLATLVLARGVLPPGWTLLAGVLAATSLLATHFAAQARPHVAAAGLLALAVAAAASLPARPTLQRYALVGLAAGAALGTLQSALAVGPPILVAHLLAQRGRSARGHWKLLVPLAITALMVAFFYPFLFEAPVGGPRSGVRLERGMLVQGGHKLMLGLFDGGGFPLLLKTLLAWEPALLLGALLAVGVGPFHLARPRALPALPRPAALVMLAYALPYGLVVGLYSRSYERFLLPLVPFLAILAAWGLMRLAARSPRARWIALGVAILLSVSSGTLAARLAWLRTRPSTLDEAQAWLMPRIGPRSARTWLSRPLTLPALQAPQGEWTDEQDLPLGLRSYIWSRYRRTVLAHRPGPRLPMAFLPVGRKGSLLGDELRRDPDRYMQRLLGGRYVLSEVFTEDRYHSDLTVLTRELRERFALVARFEPGDGSEHPLLYQDPTLVRNRPMALRVLRSKRLGPVLELYDLHSAPEGG